MIRKTIIILWIVATLIEGCAVVSMAVRRILGKNLPLSAFLGTEFVRSIMGMVALYRGDEFYITQWLRHEWVSFINHAVLGLGAFWKLARCYRDFFPFGYAVMIAIGGLAAMGALFSMWLMDGRRNGMIEAIVFAERHSESFWLVFIVLGMVFLQQARRVQVSPNSQLNALISVAYLVASIVGATLSMVDGMKSPTGPFSKFGDIGMQVAFGGCYLAWALWMTARGEIVPPRLTRTENEKAAAERLRRRLDDEGLEFTSVL